MEQQHQNTQTEESISLIDIVRLLLGKLKLLILVVLIGGILGGAFAVWRTVDVHYFGTKVEFYVNPERPEESTGTSAGTAAGGSQYGVYGAYGRHVMDNMIKLLRSDSFAERLLLNGKYLPDVENTQWFDDDEVNSQGTLKNVALKNAIEAAQQPIQSLIDAETAYNEALAAKVTAVKAYNKSETDLNTAWRKALSNGEIVSQYSTFSEKAYADLTTIPDALKNAYVTYVEKQNTVALRTTDVVNAEEVWLMTKKTVFQGDDSPVEMALNIWRESDLYEEQLDFYNTSVSYDYLESNEDYEDANNLARSFIYVKISIQDSNIENGLATGAMLLDRVKKVVPMYVAENMTIPDGYSGTNCQRITRTDDIRLTNPMYTTTEAIKYAILMAAVAFVAAAVIIILLDRSDKRLRDTEIIARKFNVPLLGIVPTIDELKADQTMKKKIEKTTEVK